MFSVIVIKYYTFKQLINATISLILITINLCASSYDMLYSVLYFYITCYYFQLRIHVLNSCILKLMKSPCCLGYYSKIRKIIIEHNQICLQIKLFNTFWRIFYFCLILTIFPISLILLVTILFTKLELFAFVLYALILMVVTKKPTF